MGSAYQMVQAEEPYCFTSNYWGRVHCQLGGREGGPICSPVPERTWNKQQTSFVYIQWGGILSKLEVKVCSLKQVYWVPISLPLLAGIYSVAEHQESCRKAEPSQHPNEATADKYREWMEGIMDEYLQNWVEEDLVPILDMTEEQLGEAGLRR